MDLTFWKQFSFYSRCIVGILLGVCAILYKKFFVVFRKSACLLGQVQNQIYLHESPSFKYFVETSGQVLMVVPAASPSEVPNLPWLVKVTFRQIEIITHMPDMARWKSKTLCLTWQSGFQRACHSLPMQKVLFVFSLLFQCEFDHWVQEVSSSWPGDQWLDLHSVQSQYANSVSTCWNSCNAFWFYKGECI